MVWQVILCGLLAVSESGDWSAIIKAQQLFHEVYGKKIEAAKTPEAKAALAKELLELAKKETDQLAKRVELEEAKKLAVEARDISLAVNIAKELATTEKTDLPSDLITEAELLWQKATDESSSDSTLIKLDAIELFFRSRTPSPLLAQKWEMRITELIRNTVGSAHAGAPVLTLADKRFLHSLHGATIILINRKSNLPLRVVNSAAGSQVIQSKATDTPDSALWLVEVLEDGTCRLRNKHSALWLGTASASRQSVPPLAVHKNFDDEDSKWVIVRSSPDAVFIIHYKTTLALAPWAGSSISGRGIHLYKVTPDHSHLQWRIVVAARAR